MGQMARFGMAISGRTCSGSAGGRDFRGERESVLIWLRLAGKDLVESVKGVFYVAEVETDR